MEAELRSRGTLSSTVQLNKRRGFSNGQTAERVAELRTCAQSDQGFRDDDLRRKAWPILLCCSSDLYDVSAPDSLWRGLAPHKDEAQVELDVNRAFVYYPKGGRADANLRWLYVYGPLDEDERKLKIRKQQLSDLIVQVLRKHPQLNYFQGYHDIEQVLLLMLGADLAAQALAHLSFLHIRDFMLPSLTPSIAQLNLVPSILKAVHPRLFRHLSATQPVFALSATLTMYAHHVRDFGEIARLFDFLLAQPAVLSLYFFVTIISSRSEELLEIEADDSAVLHSVLSKLPSRMNFEHLITQTVDNFVRHPPESFPLAWWRISSHSALKTTRWGLGSWTVRQGKKSFAAQAREVDRQEASDRMLAKIWEHRANGVRIGVATSVAIVSYWLATKVGTEWSPGK